ncbi:uncharacterized protein LOC144411816 [Styela clava]
MFNLTLSVRGLFNKNTMDFQLHFIRREGETYIIDQQLKTSFLAKLKKLYFDTPGGGATNEELDTYADNLFRGEYFFMTDYDTYFVMGFCTPIGLKGFSHFRTITPTAKAIYNMWNVFATHNQIIKIKSNMSLYDIYIVLVLLLYSRPVVGQEDIRLCTKLYEYCKLQQTSGGQSEPCADQISEPGRVGKTGPRGMPGQKREPGVVDYNRVNAKISEEYVYC